VALGTVTARRRSSQAPLDDRAAVEPVPPLDDFALLAVSFSWVSVPVVANLVAFTPVRGHPLSTIRDPGPRSRRYSNQLPI